MSEAEIAAAVGNGAGNAAAVGNAANAANANVANASVGAGAVANANANANVNANANSNNAANANAANANAANANAANANAAAGVNVQSFTGNLGGAAPAVIQDDTSDRPFSVDGSTFLNIGAALQRSCSVQHNACANAANSGQVAGGTAACEQQQDDCDAAAQAQKARRSSMLTRRRHLVVAARQQQALDTGSCGSAEIQFAVGLDGRKEASFQAVNLDDFNHGSANNIAIISDFICGQLAGACGAGEATVAACDAGSQAAQAATGQAAADAFNQALGA